MYGTDLREKAARPQPRPSFAADVLDQLDQKCVKALLRVP